METKTPVVLIVFVQTSRLRWFAAGLALEGQLTPLVRSVDGDIAPYLTMEPDEQTSFLRHRLSGVLQKGCNALWARREKPCQLAFVMEEGAEPSFEKMFHHLADHFVEWMTNPPVVFFALPRGATTWQEVPVMKLSGEVSREMDELLRRSISELLFATTNPDRWELSQKKVS